MLVYKCSTYLRLDRMEVKPQDFRRAAVGIQLFHLPEVSQDGGKTPGQVLVYNCSTHLRIARIEVNPQDLRRAGVGIQLFHSPEDSQDGGKTPQLQEGQVLVYICSTCLRLARMEVKPHNF